MVPSGDTMVPPAGMMGPAGIGCGLITVSPLVRVVPGIGCGAPGVNIGAGAGVIGAITGVVVVVPRLRSRPNRPRRVWVVGAATTTSVGPAAVTTGPVGAGVTGVAGVWATAEEAAKNTPNPAARAIPNRFMMLPPETP